MGEDDVVVQDTLRLLSDGGAFLLSFSWVGCCWLVGRGKRYSPSEATTLSLSRLRIYESLRLSRLLFTLVPSRPSISVKVVFLSSYSIHPNARKREINECFEWALHSYLHVLWFEINFSFRSIRWRLPCFCFASYACMKWIQRVQDFFCQLISVCPAKNMYYVRV